MASDAKSINVKRLPTGIFALDVEIGGGLPQGRIVAIHGPESSGKTTMAAKFAGQVQKKPKQNKVAWIDLEGAFDRDWFEKQGMDLDKTILVQPDAGAKGLDIAEELLRTGELGMLVVDSVAMVVPDQEIEESIEHQGMALQARLINKFMRKIGMALQPGDLTGEGNQCIVLLLNQERATMDKYHPIVTPGGKGKEFAASIIIGIRRGDWIAEEGDAKKFVGHEIHFKTEKNKCSPPKKAGVFDFYFSACHPFEAGAVDNEKSILLYGVEKFIIERSGSIYSYKGQKFKGKEELLEYFKGHPKEVEDIKQQLLQITPRLKEALDEPKAKKKTAFKLRMKK
jgi:recombination protein RecA